MNTPLRIASLVPSVTELLFALGLGPWVIARTGFCIHPADGVRDVPKVGGTKDVHVERLRALAPTHVLVNVDENPREVAEQLRSFAPQVIVTHPCSPADVDGLIATLAAAFERVPGVRTRARALRRELAAELAATQPGQARPVLYLVWRAPWMTVARDTYISRLLALAGWHTLPAVDGGDAGAARYPVVRGDERWLADVREVLLSSEPYAFTDAHVDEARCLCPGARVRLVDGELLSWYGPRTAAGLRYLRSLTGAPGA